MSTAARNRASDIVVSGLGLSTWLGDGSAPLRVALHSASVPLIHAKEAGVLEDERVAGAVRTELTDRVAREALRQARLSSHSRGCAAIVVAQADGLGSASPSILPAADRVVLSHACASVGFGFDLARAWLRADVVDHVLIMGVCLRTTHELEGMKVTRTLAPEHARPFDLERDGTVVGQGAGAVVLERRETASARGLTELVTVAGVACRVGAQSMAGLDAPVAAACVEWALAEGGAETVDHVHAHATGTWAGDDAELDLLSALSRQNGAPISVSSHKGCVGHLLHCSMFPGLAVAIAALRDRVAPGTPGLRQASERHGLRILRDPEPLPRCDSVMINGFGFGNNNATVLLRI